MSATLNSEALQRVLEIETERQENGHMSGWTYYRCEEEDLLKELAWIEKYGKLSRWDPEFVKGRTAFKKSLSKALRKLIQST